MLDCGHPKACEYEPDDPDLYEGPPAKACAWCDEVADLKRQVEDLERCVDKQSLTVHSGSVTLTGDIGLMRMYGGMISQYGPASRLPHTVLDAGGDKENTDAGV